MRWFDRHIDRWLQRWALGELTPAQASRLLRHVHACARCRVRYEKWVCAQRALESGDPTVPSSAEQAGLTAAGLEAALAAADPVPKRVSWRSWGALGGVLAFVCLALVLAPFSESTLHDLALAKAKPGDWQARGSSKPEPVAVLRVFCSAPGKALEELGPDQSCPRGAKLAFAVKADPVFSFLTVQLCPNPMEGVSSLFASGSPDENAMRAFATPLHGQSGEEIPLERMFALPQTPGMREVVAVFATSREAVMNAMPCHIPEGAVVRRQPVWVAEGL